MGNRIYFLDNLRTAMIFLGILAAAASGFMLFSPDQAYVIQGSVLDGQRSASFDIFYTWADAIIIPVLFFICGYFGASSLRIRQLKPFIQKKWHRIGWIWLLGSLILTPQLAYLATGSLNDTTNFFSFYIVHFWTDRFEQGQFWFLGILLALYLILMAAKKLRPHCLQHVSVTKPSWPVLLGIVILDGAIMTAMYIYYGNRWIHPLYIFMFQPVHLADYFLYFLFGTYAFKHRWFTKSGYCPSALWLIPFFIFSLAYAGYKIPMIFLLATPYYIWFLPAIKAILSLTAVMGLLGAFAAWGNGSGKTTLTLTSISYPVYVISQTLLQNTAWLLQPLAVNGLLKFILICGLALIYSYMLGKYVLIRIPPFRKQ